jgi:hypothetical protein
LNETDGKVSNPAQVKPREEIALTWAFRAIQRWLEVLITLFNNPARLFIFVASRQL